MYIHIVHEALVLSTLHLQVEHLSSGFVSVDWQLLNGLQHSNQLPHQPHRRADHRHTGSAERREEEEEEEEKERRGKRRDYKCMYTIMNMLVTLLIRCTMNVRFGPSKLSFRGSSAGRALCLECGVPWLRIPSEAAHFSLRKVTTLGVLRFFALLLIV